MPSVVVGEGAVDVVVIRAIAPALDVPKPDDNLVGREGAMRRAAVAAKMLHRQVVLVLDRNGHTPKQIESEVAARLGESWGGPPARHEGWFDS